MFYSAQWYACFCLCYLYCTKLHFVLGHWNWFWQSKQVFGSITKPLISALLLQHAKPNISDATDIPSLEDLRLLFLEPGEPSGEGNSQPARKGSSFRLLMTHPTSTAHYLWRKFDDKFMRPVFGGRGFVPFVPGSPSGAAEAAEHTPWNQRLNNIQ